MILEFCPLTLAKEQPLVARSRGLEYSILEFSPLIP